MDIPETKYLGRPYRRPSDSLYDYEICADEEGLSRILDEINFRRYHLVTVTQDPGGKYTVFFLKPVL